MNEIIHRTTTLVVLVAGILTIFVGRTLVAAHHDGVPMLSDLFNTLTVLGALGASIAGVRRLHRGDWIAAICLGAAVGFGMRSATLFSPYPFLGVVRGAAGQAVVRGLFTCVATLGGCAIMRRGGPIDFAAARGDWETARRGLLIGIAVGLPLAVANVIALQVTSGEAIASAIDWQSPWAAAVDALQPGIAEEVIYRFAAWGLLWLALRRSLGERAPFYAGLLALLVHNYGHFDALFIEAPLVALAMGLVMGLLWGIPPLLLARRRGLESAIAFHWLQDAARFLTGF